MNMGYRKTGALSLAALSVMLSACGGGSGGGDSGGSIPKNNASLSLDLIGSQVAYADNKNLMIYTITNSAIQQNITLKSNNNAQIIEIVGANDLTKKEGEITISHSDYQDLGIVNPCLTDAEHGAILPPGSSCQGVISVSGDDGAGVTGNIEVITKSQGATKILPVPISMQFKKTLMPHQQDQLKLESLFI